MPRFLDTHTGEFVLKNDPATARYAILSHTWRSEANGGEQTYDVVIELQRQSRLSPLRRDGVASCAPCPCQSCGGALSVSPLLWHRDSKLSDKIKGICKVAREAGYKLLWVDSCCIDKSSSAELSEAIKSMWEWDLRFGPFGASQWHRRGWTLQELIAPDDVVFMTRRWEVFGTKIGLAETLDQITGIDVSILTGQVDIRSVSVACRMSWAAKRKTTRVEDQAYCLMGIFGVHITPIYGEGTNAFLRLQEEIIRTIADQSIFAWGYANCTAQNPESEAGTEPGLHGIEEWERYVEDIETGFLDLPALEYDTPLGTAVNTRLPRIDQILGQVPRIDHTYVPEVKQSNNITLSGAVDMARTTYEFHSTDSEHHESGPSTPSSTHSSLPHTASQHTNDSEFLMHDEIPPSPEDIGHRGFESSVLGIHYEDEAGPPDQPPDVSPPIAAWDPASVPATGPTRHGLSWWQVVLGEDVDNGSTPPGTAAEQTPPEIPSGEPSCHPNSESRDPTTVPLSESSTGIAAPTGSNASLLHEDAAPHIDESHHQKKAIEALRSENDAMRAQMSIMAAQMAAVSAQLEVLVSAAACQRASTPGPPAFLRSVRKIFRRFSKRQDGRA
ncbi:uncharacterized protein TRAVEDRAFT_73247 [Trametes versicolor FP-101664 SS1]|uniref:uncharacterized protein n=1 Tax=Trametes versicolor (strain FP-101664) TaxID=717944 RepID=UPI00046228D7|nr:uncharacterized protein TRAVEDRAFT_73247 [Trametes versicolor FP-101664 SS1]EIW56881.1 hypothetical protein TRAVEDRAFT_73247 [Trametes versicolor FP-101664 SS1]